MAFPYRGARPTEDNRLVKARHYVSDPSEVPEGYELQEGQRGGLYYETEGESEGQATLGPHTDAEEPPRGESEVIPEGRELPDSKLVQDGLDGDIEHAAEYGNLQDVEAVIAEYGGSSVKSEDGYHYYSVRDDDGVHVVEAEDGFATTTPFDEWMNESWSWNGGYEEFLDEDISAEYNEEFWQEEDSVGHATSEEAAAKILTSGELQARNATRGINNRSVGRAVFTSRDFTFDVYGDVDFEVDVEAMREDDSTPFVSQEPPIEEAERKRAIADQFGAHDYFVSTPHDMSEDTAVIHDDIPLKYLDIEASEETLDAVEAEIDSAVEDNDTTEERAEDARAWLSEQRGEDTEWEEYERGDEKFLSVGDEVRAERDGEEIAGEIKRMGDQELIGVETADGEDVTIESWDIEEYHSEGDDYEDLRQELREHFEGVGGHSDALNAYTDDKQYREFQEHLRSASDAASESPMYDSHPKMETASAILATADEDTADTLDGIQRQAKKSLPEEMVVHRGIDVDEEFMEKAENAAESGEVISDEGFQSATINDDVAGGFGNVTLDIRTDHGVYVRAASEHAGEDEILLPAGTEYEVQNVDRETGTVDVVATGGFDFNLNVDAIRDAMQENDLSYAEAVNDVI